MNYKKDLGLDKEPACVFCSLAFIFKEPTKPFGSRCPLLLHCGHAACEGCLKAIIRGNGPIKCPKCSSFSETTNFRNSNELRKEFPLSVYAVGQVSLKRNKSKSGEALIGFYSKNKKQEGPSPVFCGECSTASADCSCRQCNTQLCNACFTSIHNSSVTLRKHEKIILDETDNMLLEEAVCSQHQNLFCSLFCEDCELYGCKECIMADHLNHRCIDVFEKNEEKLSEFSDLFDEAIDVLKHLHATRKKLRQSFCGGEKQDEEFLSVKKQVMDHFSHLHGLLQLQEEELMKKINSATEATNRSLEGIVNDLDSNIKEVEGFLKLSKKSLEQTNFREFPLDCLLEKLKNITGTPCHLVPTNNADSSKFQFYVDPEVAQYLKGHCTVKVPEQKGYELHSKFDLPENFEVENVKSIPDPFAKPDLKLIKTVKSEIKPQAEVKTKPSSMMRKESNKTMSQKHSSSENLSISSLDSAFEKICSVQVLEEGTTEIVRMSHFLSPNSFYVQRKCNLLQIGRLRTHFSKQANIKRNPPANIEFGKTYLVCYSSDNKWYRGRVTNVEGNQCEIFYVDYGNTETVNKSKLREIPEKFMEIPEQAIHCGLVGCRPLGGEWNIGAYRLISRKAHGKDISMFVEKIHHPSDFHEVHLRNVDDMSGSYTDILILMQFATAIDSTTNIPAFGIKKTHGKQSIKNEIIKEQESFEGQVTHINSPSNFYIQKIVDGGELLIKLMRDLSETYLHCKPTKDFFIPEVGMAVAAKQNDGSWYRAEVLRIPEPKLVEVKYVDFGSVGTIKWEDVRYLENKFLKCAAQALRCALHDIAPKNPKGWSQSAKQVFESMACDKGLLKVHVETVKEDNSLSITLYETTKTMYINIGGLLVKKGHAVSTGLSSTQAEYSRSTDPNSKSELKSIHESDTASGHSEVAGTSKTQKTLNKKRAEVNKKAEAVAEVKTEEVDDDVKAKVKVLKVVSPSEIYLTSPAIQKQINKLINTMTSYYQSSQSDISRDWDPSDLCAVLRKSDSKWYRGVVSDVSIINYKVYIKDIVEVVEVNSSALRTLEDQFKRVPDGSVRVHMGGILCPAGLKNWPSSATDHLRILMEDAECLYIEKLGEHTNDSIPVRLWKRIQHVAGPLEPIKDEWRDLNKSLVTIGLALTDNTSDSGVYANGTEDSTAAAWLGQNFEPIHSEDGEENVTESYNEVVSTYPNSAPNVQEESSQTSSDNQSQGHKSKPITEWKPPLPFKALNFIATASYVDYDCNIYLQEDNGLIELLEKTLMLLYETTAKHAHDEDWFVGEICVAKYHDNQKWYRGKIKKVTPDLLEVLFVDFGNVEELCRDEVRKLVSMAHIPIQCHCCSMEGIIPVSPNGKWPIKVLDFIHQEIVTKQVHVSLKAPTEDNKQYVILSLKLPCGEDLVDTLLNMHYATYVIDCNEIEEEEDDDDLIIDEMQSCVVSNIESSKLICQQIHNVVSNMKSPKSLEINILPPDDCKEEGTLETDLKNVKADQHYDWFEMSERDGNDLAIELKFKEILLPDSLVEFTVDVTAMCSSNSLIVNISECDDLEISRFGEEFRKQQEHIQEEARLCPILSNPSKGLPCIGCYSEDDVWYRAVIKEFYPLENAVKLQYVDYGNVEKIALNSCRVREIRPEWTLTPIQGIRVTLHNVREGPIYDKDACQEAFMACIMHPPYTMTIESRFPRLEVELYNDEGQLVYEPLLESGLLSRDP